MIRISLALEAPAYPKIPDPESLAERIFNALIRTRIAAIGFENEVVRRVLQGNLAAKRLLLFQIEQLRASGLRDLSETSRLQLLDAVNRAVAVALNSTRAPLVAGIQELAQAQANLLDGQVLNVMRDAIPVGSLAPRSIASPDPAVLRALSDLKPLGQSIAAWRETFAFKIPDRAASALARVARAGGGLDDATSALRGVFDRDLGPDLETLARTALAETSERVREEVWKQNPELITHRQWTAALDDRTCPICAPLDGQVFRVDDERAPRAPIHPNCFPGGVLVKGPAFTKRFSRRYEGEILILQRTAGDPLAVTPNHPVLTRRGWIPAASLEHGEELIDGAAAERCLKALARGPDDQQVETLIQDAARSRRLALLGVPLARPDFHGDGIDGEVDVEVLDGLFSNVRETASEEETFEDGFGFRGFAGSIAFLRKSHSAGLLERSLAPTNGRMGGLREMDSLCVGSLRHAREHRLASVARLNAHLEQARTDRDSFAMKELGTRLLARSGEVKGSKLVKIDHQLFAGHVFNLETRSGWYAANGVIVHNCRCISIPVIPDEPFPERLRASGSPGRPDVSARTTFSGWLRSQPASVQREVLGPTRLRLWKSGVLPLSAFSDAGRLLTLDELRARFGRAVRDLIPV